MKVQTSQHKHHQPQKLPKQTSPRSTESVKSDDTPVSILRRRGYERNTLRSVSWSSAYSPEETRDSLDTFRGDDGAACTDASGDGREWFVDADCADETLGAAIDTTMDSTIDTRADDQDVRNTEKVTHQQDVEPETTNQSKLNNQNTNLRNIACAASFDSETSPRDKYGLNESEARRGFTSRPLASCVSVASENETLFNDRYHGLLEVDSAVAVDLDVVEQHGEAEPPAAPSKLKLAAPPPIEVNLPVEEEQNPLSPISIDETNIFIPGEAQPLQEDLIHQQSSDSLTVASLSHNQLSENGSFDHINKANSDEGSLASLKQRHGFENLIEGQSRADKSHGHIGLILPFLNMLQCGVSFGESTSFLGLDGGSDEERGVEGSVVGSAGEDAIDGPVFDLDEQHDGPNDGPNDGQYGEQYDEYGYDDESVDTVDTIDTFRQFEGVAEARYEEVITTAGDQEPIITAREEGHISTIKDDEQIAPLQAAEEPTSEHNLFCTGDDLVEYHVDADGDIRVLINGEEAITLSPENEPSLDGDSRDNNDPMGKKTLLSDQSVADDSPGIGNAMLVPVEEDAGIPSYENNDEPRDQVQKNKKGFKPLAFLRKRVSHVASRIVSKNSRNKKQTPIKENKSTPLSQNLNEGATLYDRVYHNNLPATQAHVSTELILDDLKIIERTAQVVYQDRLNNDTSLLNPIDQNARADNLKPNSKRSA